MTSIREVLQKLLLRQSEQEDKAGISYTVYWTDLVSGWSEERRHLARLAVEHIVNQSDFHPDDYTHLYHLPEVDEIAHAGSSLLALLKVLKAYQDRKKLGKEK